MRRAISLFWEASRLPSLASVKELGVLANPNRLRTFTVLAAMAVALVVALLLTVSEQAMGAESTEGGPTVSPFIPQPEATGVSRTTNVLATFSTDIDPNTVNTDNFQLFRYKGGEFTYVDAAVGCDSGWGCPIYRLDPSAAKLARRSWHMVVVWGGPDGVKDLAGNQLDPAKLCDCVSWDSEQQYAYWWFKTKRR